MSSAALERRPWLGALCIVLCGLVYANSLQGVFVYDDWGTIRGNPHIESLWPLSSSMSAPPGSGASGRPIVALSLAINYALGGTQVFGYHLFNVLVHVLTGLALFGCVRWALAWRARENGSRSQAVLHSTLIASVWMVHPLNSAALNHVTYRNEAMLALFYLLCLYGSIRGQCSERGFGGKRSGGWFLISFCSCALAMGCKEIAVSLPLAVWFVSVALFKRPWLGALRERGLFYAGLAGCWMLLAWVVSTGDRGESVGAGSEGISSVDYLRTQAGVLIHYLRLAVRPDPLVLDYRDWAVVREWQAALVPGAAVLALLGASLLALFRRNLLGVVGLLCFAVLAPTSSFIPITGAIAAEHRMYLPLAGLVIIAGAGACWIARRAELSARASTGTLVCLALLLMVPLGRATVLRNRDYQSGVSIWKDTTQKRPENSLAWSNYASALRHHGELEESARALRRAIELNPGNHKALENLGLLLREEGNLTESIESYRRAASVRPDIGSLQVSLGRVLIQAGDVPGGMQALDTGLQLGLPTDEQLAVAFEVATVYATAEEPQLRNGARALELAERLNQATGGNRAQHLELLACAFAENGRFPEAIATVRKALLVAESRSRANLTQRLGRKRSEFEAGRPWRQAVR